MKTAITFVNNRQASMVSTKEELINEYSNPIIDKNDNCWKGNVRIIVHDLTEDDKKWLSTRMR